MVGHGSVATLAFHSHKYFVGAGHVHTLTESNFTHRNIGSHVLAKHGTGSRVFQYAILNHERGPTRCFLFGRLKHQFNCPRKLVAQGLQNPGRTEQTGGVGIVSASVHNALHRRFIGYLVGFADGQRVHVGPQPNHPPGPSFRPFDQSHNARVGHTLLRIQADGAELFGHITSRIMLMEREFGVGVQVSARGNGVGGKLSGKRFDGVDHAEPLVVINW